MVAATEVNSVDLQRSPGKFGEVTRERIRRLVDLVRRRFLTCGASSFRVAERPSRTLYSLWTSAASPSGLRAIVAAAHRGLTPRSRTCVQNRASLGVGARRSRSW